MAASKDDLSEQLNITTKLNSVVEKMAKSVSNIGDSYETQINTLERLTLAVNGINSTKSVEQLDQIVASLKAITDNFKKISDDSTLTDLTNNAGKANTATVSLGNSLATAGAAMAKGAEKGSAGMSGFGSEIVSAVESMIKFESSVETATKGMNGKFVKGVAMAVGALHGLEQGFENVVALSKGVLGFATSFASGVLNIGAAILSIPLKIFTGLVDMAAASSGGANELMEAIENLRKEMGDLNKSGSKAVLETTKTLKGFSDTGLSTWRVFGTLAERLQLMTKTAVAMGSTFGSLKKEFVDNGGALLAYQKGLGVTDEQMKGLGDRAITTGQPLGKMFKDITKQTTMLGNAFDIDQKLIGKDMGKAAADVKHFGSVTVKEIGSASVYARKLGVELDKITGTLDQFETFDSAAESAAKLGQSFGVTVDAFQLMEEQDPAKQLDILRKSFKDAGVDSSSFSRQQLKLLAANTGLDEATAKQVFSLKNQGVSYDEIKKKSETAEKKTMSQAEAMQQLSSSIERLVKSGQGMTGSFFDQFVKGFLRGIQSTTEFRQMIQFIQRDLQTAMLYGVKLGKKFEEIFPGVKDFFGGIRDLFEPSKFIKFFSSIDESFTNFFKNLTTGKYSFSELMDNLHENFFSFFDKGTGPGQKILSGFTTFIKTISGIITQAIPWITTQLGIGLKSIADIISGKNKLSGLHGAAQGSLGFLTDLIMPIIAALKDAWKNPTLRQGLSDFVSSIGDMIEEAINSPVFNFLARHAIGTLLFVMFAPAVFQSLLADALVGIGKLLVKGLVKMYTMAFADKAITTAAETLASSTATTVSTSLESGLEKSATSAAPGIASKLGGFVTGAMTLATSSMGTIAAGGAAAIAAAAAAVVAAAVGGFFAGKAITDSLDNAVNTTGKSINEAGQSLFETMTSSIGIAEKRAELERHKALLAQQQKALQERSMFTEFWETMGKKAGTTQADTLARTEAFIRDQDILLKKEEAQAKKVSDVEAAKAAKKTTATSHVNFLGSNSVDDAEEKLTKLQSLATKLNGKNFNVEAVLTSVRDKLKDVNFTIFDDKKAKQIDDLSGQVDSLVNVFSGLDTVGKAMTNLSHTKLPDMTTVFNQIDDAVFHVGGLLTNIDQSLKSRDMMNGITDRLNGVTSVFDSLQNVSNSFKAAVQSIKVDGIKPALDAVKNMIKLVNDLDSALADGNLNKVDVKAKLANVANAVGLGGKATYTVTSKPVNITVNMTVTMNVDDIEQAMVMRANSVIRDRLNFATGDNAGRKGSPMIPETRNPNLPKIQTAD